MDKRMTGGVDAYQEAMRWDGGPEIILHQLLVDARLYADAHGLDFGAVDREAYQGYLEVKD